MWGKRADMIVHEESPFNAEPTPAALDDGHVTALDTFYVRNHGPVPEVDPGAWRLRVDGLTGRSVELSLADLQETFAEQRVMATMQCAGNRRAELIAIRDIPGEDPWGRCATSTAWWTGVRLGDVLRHVGVEEGAAHVAFDAPDVSEIPDPPEAYGASIPLAKALSDEVLLAWAMNDEALPPVHGGPVRVVVPGYIGARSVKWVERVTVRSEPSEGHFQATAYRLVPADTDIEQAGPDISISLGEVALNCEVLVPAQDAEVAAGEVEVSGYALAGGPRDVARVDVSTDDGATWTQAELAEPTDWTWRPWRAVVDVAPGEAEILVRAWDSTGACQPRSASDLWNPKGYVNNSWASVGFTAR